MPGILGIFQDVVNTGLYRLLQAFTSLYGILPTFTGLLQTFYRPLWTFTGLYRHLQAFRAHFFYSLRLLLDQSAHVASEISRNLTPSKHDDSGAFGDCVSPSKQLLPEKNALGDLRFPWVFNY